jgi:hypothetical protein
MNHRPRRCKAKTEVKIADDVDCVNRKIGEIVLNNKKMNGEQVKTIWDLLSSLQKNEESTIIQDEDSNEWEDQCNNRSTDNEDKEQDEDVDVDGLNWEKESYTGKNQENGGLEWDHMYPVRKSLYNRRTHFISFVQNYTSYAMGRKLMSEYENNMCDFIFSAMRPTSALDFLMMLKECKLSNVYRFYEHLFHAWKNDRESRYELEIAPNQIDGIVHLFTMFQAFFHRQNKFNRKNFLSMRFLLGKILLFLGIIKSCIDLPVDLRRPKGKSQLLFHEQVWQLFLDSM